ncbi:MAG: CRISPR-associated endonuclease Cas2 [Clostridia bacterium]|nr:CRISPR-associated endonuclease Cas2 [Clostridia bacterium]
MFVILSYDAESRRCGKLRKIVKRYLHPVQRSLFQGFLTEKQCRLLKEELAKAVDTEKDAVILYKLADAGVLRTDEIGTSELREVDIL